jgi:hypothetical protein
MEDVMFRKGFASFLIAAAATAALSTSVTAQVRTAALQSTGFQLAQAAQAESRVALVIGNSAYQVNKPLNNPVNDAQAVSQMLNQAGFEVVMAFDLTRDIMKQTVEEFAARVLEKGSNTVAMVYYAGHGIQADGENYLIPIDAKFSDEDDLPEQGVKLADVVAALEATQTKARIVVVDACRNNPFGGSANDDNGGLALVDAPEGALIAYSTAPGTVAFDGLGKHSPYAAAFMRTARTPNLPVEQVFKKVRLLVNDSTDKKQTPWDSARLNTEFVFFASADAPAPAVVPVRVAVAELGSRPVRQAYEIAIAEDSEDYYEEFVRVYGADPLADHVRRVLNRRKQMVAWQNVTHRNRPEDYADFARRFRNTGLGFRAQRLQERPRQINIAFPRRGEGRFGDGRFGNVRINIGNDGRRLIKLGGREGFGNGGRQVINFANVGNNNGRPGFNQNGGNNNGRPFNQNGNNGNSGRPGQNGNIGNGNNGNGRPVINQNGQNGNNNGGRPVINQNGQNGNNNGGRPVLGQNGNNGNNNGRPGQNGNGNNGNGNNGNGRPVIDQNGNNGGRPVINQNGQNNGRVIPFQNGNTGITGRGRPNPANVAVNQGRRDFQPQVIRNEQFQQRAPQIQRQNVQAPRQNFQPRAFNGGGGGGNRFASGGGGGGNRFGGGGGFGGGRGGGGGRR